jgi:hypothetical protein
MGANERSDRIQRLVSALESARWDLLLSKVKWLQECFNNVAPGT